MGDSTMLAVLHGVRLASVVGADELAVRTGIAPEVVVDTLEVCRSRGWVRHRDGRLSGWSLTIQGRGEGERLLAEELDAAGRRDVVETAHHDFLPLNTTVLAVCTDWQVLRRDGIEVPNDHADEEHDLAVLERLGRVHAEARPLLRRLTGALERFAAYDRRLGVALDHVVAGRTEWFTRPTIDSYHTVWFELHEDLLATLGLRRADEPANAPHTEKEPVHPGRLEEHA